MLEQTPPTLNGHRWTKLGTDKMHSIQMSWTDGNKYFVRTGCDMQGVWDQTVVDNLASKSDGCDKCVGLIMGTWEEPTEKKPAAKKTTTKKTTTATK